MAKDKPLESRKGSLPATGSSKDNPPEVHHAGDRHLGMLKSLPKGSKITKAYLPPKPR